MWLGPSSSRRIALPTCSLGIRTIAIKSIHLEFFGNKSAVFKAAPDHARFASSQENLMTENLWASLLDRIQGFRRQGHDT
jgi:hypothetical protein